VRHQARPIASDAEFELPPLDETRWTREQLLDALKNDTQLRPEVLGLATIYASEIEPDIVATFGRARVEELDPATDNLLFRGAHILGAARLTGGYRALLALLTAPHDRIERLFGDAVIENLPKILAGMFDDDAEPLLTLIADGSVHDWVRESALRTLAFLTFDGRIDRAAAEEFLTRFDQQGMAAAEDAAWHGWMTAVALLGLERLSPRVYAAFEDGRLPLEIVDEEDYRVLLAAALERPADPARFEDEHLGYIEDVVEALQFFSDEDPEEFPTDDMEWLDERRLEWAPDRPARNPWRDVGRNDPCPCGSGKKFKKCCLPAQA
jgi:Protein of unknown function (DUF1186)/SEC-C motif